MGKKLGSEVVQSPANTSHFLQPCDYTIISLLFSRGKDEFRDAKLDELIIDTKTVHFIQMRAVARVSEGALGSCPAKLGEIELWPIYYRFVEYFEHDFCVKRTEKRNQEPRRAPRETGMRSWEGVEVEGDSVCKEKTSPTEAWRSL